MCAVVLRGPPASVGLGAAPLPARRSLLALRCGDVAGAKASGASHCRPVLS